MKIKVEANKLQKLKAWQNWKQLKVYKVVLAETLTLVRLEVVYQKKSRNTKIRWDEGNITQIQRW